MEVTNTGASPVFSLNVGDTFSVPGIGNVTCTEITGNDEYSNDGTRRWTIIYAWTDGNGQSDTRYNFSIEKNGSDNTITTGSRTVTNTGNTPSNVVLPDTLTLPGIGNLPCVKVSGSDDYDNNGNHVWTVTHEATNKPETNEQQHNTKYNISIEKNENNNTITTGSKTVTNSGNEPSDLTFGENLNLPGVGNIPLVKVSASDDYDDDGSHVWTVVHEGSNAPVQQQNEHDTKYNFTVEKNGNEAVTTGTKTVTSTGNNPALAIQVGGTLNIPGIGNVTCTKITGNDDYDDDGTQKWTVTYESSDANDEQQSQNEKYNINVEKNSDGVVVYSGTKEMITAEQPQSLPASVGDILSFPLIGQVTCVRVTSHNNDDSTWSVIIECSSDGNSSGGEGGSGSIPLPETEEIINYDLNGYTVRTVKGDLLVLQRSNNYVQKKTITEYSNSPSPLRSNYDNNGQTVISETISKETITNNGSSATYYKHVIEVES